ncbi:single-stranded DNA-binding protein, mitochondrial [Rhodamnia argentea]|uniref:Single-stranded DNA-binding protein, mitochondrial n=1 Tax=Rhodamnia argentea TaxID=178133 RepID=A0A8B8MYA4_9MYRT|nr:single-stranded DNA-binding protein, mitochondrial [Rhodamnia argentea]
MATSLSKLSSHLHRCLLSNPRAPGVAMSLCTAASSQDTSEPEDRSLESEADSAPSQQSPPAPASSAQEPEQQRTVYDRPLQNGLDTGIYKAIIMGQVGQNPIAKKLKSGRTVTLFSVGTGGVRNNRRPLQNEEPREYADRSLVQWHRVSVYPEALGEMVRKHVSPGMILYLEGNLESKVFTDPVSGLVRRIREIAIRRNGRIVFVGKGGDSQQPSQGETRGAGYY